MLAKAAEYSLECWQLDYNAAFLNADVTEDINVKMALECDEFDEHGVPLVLGLF